MLLTVLEENKIVLIFFSIFNQFELIWGGVICFLSFTELVLNFLYALFLLSVAIQMMLFNSHLLVLFFTHISITS